MNSVFKILAFLTLVIGNYHEDNTNGSIFDFNDEKYTSDNICDKPKPIANLSESSVISLKDIIQKNGETIRKTPINCEEYKNKKIPVGDTEAITKDSDILMSTNLRGRRLQEITKSQNNQNVYEKIVEALKRIDKHMLLICFCAVLGFIYVTLQTIYRYANQFIENSLKKTIQSMSADISILAFL